MKRGERQGRRERFKQENSEGSDVKEQTGKPIRERSMERIVRRRETETEKWKYRW